MPSQQPVSMEGTKAHQVYLVLRDQIVSGVYAPGDTLPGEHRLATEFGVSRVTVRRALAALDQAQMIAREQGRGTVVRNRTVPSVPIAADFANLWSHLVEMGAKSRIRLLAFNYLQPPPAIGRQLGIEPGTRTQRSVRVRYIDDVPFSHLTTHVPEPIAKAYSEADLASTPLFVLLERHGVKIHRARQAISATLATKDTAAALDVAVGAPLIALTRTVFDVDGGGVEHLTALYRPDRYRFEMDLNRVGEGNARHWEPGVPSATTTAAPTTAGTAGAAKRNGAA